MIHLLSSRPRISRLLPAALLACTVGLLPIGTVHAQSPNYDAVGARLLKAVSSGELTPGQATAMMGALAGTHFAERMKVAFHKAKAKGKKKDKKDKKSDKKKSKSSKSKDAMIKDYMTEVKQELEVLVRAGRLSKADAQKKYDSALKAVKRKVAAGLAKDKKPAAKQVRMAPEAQARLTKIKKDLGAMVKAGKISKKDAAKKYEAVIQSYKKQMAAQARTKKAMTKKAAAKKASAQKSAGDVRMKDYLARVKKSIWAQVKAGKISEADAKKRYATVARNIKRNAAAGQVRGGQVAPRAQQTKRAAQIRRRVPTTKKQAPRTEPTRRSGRVVGMERAPTPQDTARMYRDLERKVQALRDAVDNGRITHEEARRKLVELRKKMGDAAKRQTAQRDVAEQRASDARKKRLAAYRLRLVEGVKSGRLSQEDAKRMMEEFIKKMTQARKAQEARRSGDTRRRRETI